MSVKQTTSYTIINDPNSYIRIHNHRNVSTIIGHIITDQENDMKRQSSPCYASNHETIELTYQSNTFQYKKR